MMMTLIHYRGEGHKVCIQEINLISISFQSFHSGERKNQLSNVFFLPSELLVYLFRSSTSEICLFFISFEVLSWKPSAILWFSVMFVWWKEFCNVAPNGCQGAFLHVTLNRQTRYSNERSTGSLIKQKNLRQHWHWAAPFWSKETFTDAKKNPQTSEARDEQKTKCISRIALTLESLFPVFFTAIDILPGR